MLPGLPGLRRIVPSRPIQVLLAAGRPAAVRDGETWWRVAATEGPARAVTGWWTTGQATVDRDYYLVADADGRLVVLVEDRVTGGWLLTGEID